MACECGVEAPHIKTHCVNNTTASRLGVYSDHISDGDHYSDCIKDSQMTGLIH